MKNKVSAKDQIIERNKILNPVKERRAELVAITWDNPSRKDSSEMFDALRKLGKLKKLYVKTTAVLLPKKGVTYDDIKNAIKSQLSTEKGCKGRAVIVSLADDRIAHIDLHYDDKWKKGYPKDIQ